MKKATCIIPRFLRQLKQSGECIIWTGSVNNSGYGSIMGQYKPIGTHVFSYELHSGKEIKKGYEPHHKCNNKRCVKFEHLELLTVVEHGKKHRQKFCKRGHEMTLENTITEVYSGEIHRRCKRCHYNRNNKRKGYATFN